MVKVFSLVAVLDLVFSLSYTASAWQVGQEVITFSGFYKGHASPLRPQVSEYLGIKYAHDTSGPRRFAKPVPFKSAERYAADQYGYVCPGILTNAAGPMAGVAGGNHKASEDCLSVNVWTKPQAGERKKAGKLFLSG
jgi:cholinesterase